MKGYVKLSLWLPKHMRIFHVGLFLTLMIWATSGLCSFHVDSAGASTTCSSGTPSYGGYETTHSGNEGIEGDVNYSKDDFLVYDTTQDYAASWLGDASYLDNSIVDGLYSSWIQAGFGIGRIDSISHSQTVVFSETNDYTNTSGPTLSTFPTLAWGNRWFKVFFTGTTDSNGHGLYKAYYSLSGTLLASAWLKNPNYTTQDANVETKQVNTSGYCPGVEPALFGTDGNESSPGYSSSTKIQIYTNSPAWIYWTPTDILTTSLLDAPYSRTTYDSDDAFKIYGGG